MERKKTCYIIDGNHLAFRAHCTLHLSDSKGRNTSTIYGVSEMLGGLVREYLPDALVICWDYGKSQNRKNILPTYKSSRVPKTEEERKGKEEFYVQLDDVKRIVRGFGIPQVQIQGYEGDELIYTVAKMSQKIGYISGIVTSDKDMLQLVDSDTFWLEPIQKRIVTPENFREVLGIAREDFLLYKCLIGDAGDDIPGIRGVGEVTAKKMLQKYHSIDDLVSNNEEDRRARLIRGQREILERNMKLVDLQQFISPEILIEVRNSIKEVHPVDCFKLKEIFTDYEFKSLLNELPELETLYTDLWNKNQAFLENL